MRNIEVNQQISSKQKTDCSIEAEITKLGFDANTKRVKKSNHYPTMAVITGKYYKGWWKIWLLIKIDTEMRSEFKNLHLYGHGSPLTFSIKWSTLFQFRLTRMRRLNESVHDYVIVRKNMRYSAFLAMSKFSVWLWSVETTWNCHE